MTPFYDVGFTHSTQPDHPPSAAHLEWRAQFGQEYQRLLEVDPEHLVKLHLGWSFVDICSGPRDGGKFYYVGSPPWQILVPDLDGSTPTHLYQLTPTKDNQTVYWYQGPQS